MAWELTQCGGSSTRRALSHMLTRSRTMQPGGALCLELWQAKQCSQNRQGLSRA